MAAKKKFDLDGSIVQVEKGIEQPSLSTDHYPKSAEIAKEDHENNIKMIYLNFHVSEEFRKEFKIWCAHKGLKQNHAFVKMFERIKSLDLI